MDRCLATFKLQTSTLYYWYENPHQRTPNISLYNISLYYITTIPQCNLTQFPVVICNNLPKVCSDVYRLNAPVQSLFLTGDIGQFIGNDRIPPKPSFVLILGVVISRSIRAWTLQSQQPPTNWQHDHMNWHVNLTSANCVVVIVNIYVSPDAR